MTYTTKLLIAKILITIGLSLYALLPFVIDFGGSHIASVDWSPHARFHLTWVLFGNVMALPVLLFAIWSKLHGTGRSVRLVAFLGMAYTLGFFVAASLRGRLGSDLHDAGHEHLVLGLDGNLISTGLIFAMLLLGVFFSIKRSTDNN